MWTLIGIGVGAAYGYSLAAALAPDWFPVSFHEHGRVGVYFEAAAVIVSLTLLGQLLELQARSRIRCGCAARGCLARGPIAGKPRLATPSPSHRRRAAIDSV
jgi:Cu+-exporting ATPase